MAPQLLDLQIAAGAWAITAAAVGQVHVSQRFGVQRVLLANQLLGRQHVRSAQLKFYWLWSAGW